MKLVARNALAAACLAALAGPVLADASSSASFGAVTITLIDLDPGDGIAPSLTFNPPASKYDGGGHIFGEVQSWTPGAELNRFEHVGGKQAMTLADSAQTSMASASASVVGEAGVAGFSAMSARGSAGSDKNAFGMYTSYVEVPYSYANNAFTLSAHTQVVFSVDASVSAAYTLGYAEGGRESEYAYASISFYAGGQGAGGAWLDDLQQRQVSLIFDKDAGAPSGSDSAAWQGAVSASYSNLGAGSADGQFFAQASVGGMSVAAGQPATAVPEPAAYALLLAGLVLTGAAARRRAGMPFWKEMQ